MSVSTSAPPVRAHDTSAAVLVEPWLDATADDARLLEQVATWYQRCLARHALAQQSLQRRGLVHPELLSTFQLGFADRRLGAQLPGPKRQEGRELRARLQALGILRESGHGHFNGSLTIPLCDAQGAIVDIYGRKVTRNLIRGTQLHTYLTNGQPHRGIFNGAALAGTDTIVLCDSPLNALSFWCAGLRHVTCTFHGQAITDELVALLRNSCVSKVLLAFRNTKQGVTQAEAASAQLVGAGLSVHPVTFPAHRDANDVLVTAGPERLVTLANMAAGREMDVVPSVSEPAAAAEATPVYASTTDMAPEINIQEEDTTNSPPETAMADAPQSAPGAEPPSSTPAEEPASTDGDLHFTFDDRHYRVRGLAHNHSLDRMKINLRVSRDGLFHVTLLDLYSGTQRKSFIREAASEIFAAEDLIKRDLGHLLHQLETLQEAQIQKALRPRQPQVVEVAGQERDAAVALLHDPRLLARIAADYERCGLVGEVANKQLCYLACVSRLLDAPLAVLIQSSSAAGKTTLMDATLRMTPPEEVIRYSAMTGQSLYYMGQHDMRHKVLAVAEEEGVAEASYALKLLQSDGRLRIASAGKDDGTGRHQTQDYEVEGPVMMFLTTTAEEPDVELQNRCLVVRVNESPEQTAAIHARQRARYTLAGQEQYEQRASIERTHQNAQRLLRAYRVIIPWAERLTFRQDQTRMRRDHEKYLTLIASITLLHQFQRKKVRDKQGVECLVATLEDVDHAGRLACAVMGQSLDALMPQTRQLLVLLDDHLAQRSQVEKRSRLQLRFKQRELREALGWSDFSLRTHLARLVELEYVLAYRTGRGNEREYELLYDGQGRAGEPFCLGLIKTSELVKTSTSPAPADSPAEGFEHAGEGNEPHPSPNRGPSEPQANAS